MFWLKNKKIIFWYTLLTKGLHIYKINKLLFSKLFLEDPDQMLYTLFADDFDEMNM